MANQWERYQHYRIRYQDLGFALDLSRMNFNESFLDRMAESVTQAFEDMRKLEDGEKVNVDEDRAVGHYWLRNPEIAPKELQAEIVAGVDEVVEFADAIRGGEILAPCGKPYNTVLLIGIGGSALGPQLVADALVYPGDGMAIEFFDNTDPAGMHRTLAAIGDNLSQTLALVVSKSGGTAETRNGMLEATAACERAGLDFGKQAVAVTMPGSKLDKHAEENGFIRRFSMFDWIGGRTSVTSGVGLLPAALLGVDVRQFLEGASIMDELTRSIDARNNAAMMLALMWHHVGNGHGEKDMVILPYSDRLSLLSRYLQQLVMESLGKETDRAGTVVHQGIAVYGNKGSTDQHAYVQQLRDGLNNFFVTFVEVLDNSGDNEALIVDEDGATSADYLQGFLRGTRGALYENGSESLTITLQKLDAKALGAVIALFERAVSFYASLINVNAYHQPGVEAGKKAAGEFLSLLKQVRNKLIATPGKEFTADTMGAGFPEDADLEQIYHALNHLAASDPKIQIRHGGDASDDTFWCE